MFSGVPNGPLRLSPPQVHAAVHNSGLQLLVGSDLATKLKPNLESYLNTGEAHVAVTIPQRTKTPVVRPQIPQKYEKKYNAALKHLVRNSTDTEEVLATIFKAQHVGIELPSREVDPAGDRLEFGVPLSYLRRAVERQLGEVSGPDLHRALDSLIDWGVIVPRYLSQDVDGNGVWYRSFRVGEGQAMVPAHITKECFNILSKVIGDDALPELLTEKFFVLACHLANVFDDPAFVSAPKIKRGFHLYGARPRVTVGGKSFWLVDWACQKRILERHKRAKKPHYKLHSSTRTYFPSDENPLSHSMRLTIPALARWTKEALETKRLGSKFLVAVTTVESPWAYKQALEAELRGWAHHEEWGVIAAVHSLDDLVEQADDASLHRAGIILAGLANWIAQAEVKDELRAGFQEFIARANGRWPDTSFDDTASTWRELIRKSLEERGDERARPAHVVEELVKPTITVAGRLTSLLRNILSEFAESHLECAQPALFRESKDERAKPVSESSEELTRSIEELPIQIRSQFSGAIGHLGGVARARTLQSAVESVRPMALVIARGVDEVLNCHPDISDEPLDPLESGLYVLFWDVRKSTQNKTREPLTRISHRGVGGRPPFVAQT